MAMYDDDDTAGNRQRRCRVRFGRPQGAIDSQGCKQDYQNRERTCRKN